MEKNAPTKYCYEEVERESTIKRDHIRLDQGGIIIGNL
jgi:hypothetical protein